VIGALVVAGLLLGGCGSGVSIAYRNLDWTIPIYVESYVALDARQRDRLGEHVDALLDWHCACHLERYAEWLRTVSAELGPEGIPAERVDRYYAAVLGFRDDLVAESAPRLADLLATADDAQVARLLEHLDSGNAEFRAELVDRPAQDVGRAIADQARERLQRWVGPLTAEQDERVAAWGARMAPGQAARLAQRERLREALAAALERRTLRPAFDRELEGLLRRPEELGPQAYREHLSHFRQGLVGLLAEVSATLTDTQRGRLLARLSDWAADFAAIACRGAAQGQSPS
jgi:hypothetical protein